MVRKKFVNCFTCSQQVDVEETVFGGKQQTLAAEFKRKVPVLREKLENIEIQGCKEVFKCRTCSQLAAVAETGMGREEALAADVRCIICFVTQRLHKVEKRVAELVCELSRERGEG